MWRPRAQRADHAERRDHEADAEREQIQHGRGRPPQAVARELPRADLGLAREVGLVAGDDVVQIVDPHRAPAAVGVRDLQRHAEHLQRHPLERVAAVGAEVVALVVGRARSPEGQRGVLHGFILAIRRAILRSAAHAVRWAFRAKVFYGTWRNRPRDTALAGPAFGYVDFGVAHGLSREALMRAAGLDERLRGDPDARVSTFAYMVLWRELLTGLPGVAVPVEYVRTLDLGDARRRRADLHARR